MLLGVEGVGGDAAKRQGPLPGKIGDPKAFGKHYARNGSEYFVRGISGGDGVLGVDDELVGLLLNVIEQGGAGPERGEPEHVHGDVADEEGSPAPGCRADAVSAVLDEDFLKADALALVVEVAACRERDITFPALPINNMYDACRPFAEDGPECLLRPRAAFLIAHHEQIENDGACLGGGAALLYLRELGLDLFGIEGHSFLHLRFDEAMSLRASSGPELPGIYVGMGEGSRRHPSRTRVMKAQEDSISSRRGYSVASPRMAS